MKFTLEIQCDNAAFHEDAPVDAPVIEIMRILRQANSKLSDGHGLIDEPCLLRDSNRNTVGSFVVTDD